MNKVWRLNCQWKVFQHLPTSITTITVMETHVKKCHAAIRLDPFLQPQLQQVSLILKDHVQLFHWYEVDIWFPRLRPHPMSLTEESEK